ncbi:MAG: ribonuclease III [Rickettsiales bacterium]|jgi:ribonuclease-3|nr:ribonuclease III [Rickettsiales bacterium]
MLQHLYKILNYTFKNENIIETALTHPSISDKKNGQSYQRLEFLGDAVLGLTIIEALLKCFPKLDEGRLSNMKHALVDTKTLANIGEKIGLGDYIYMSPGEEKNGGRNNPKILEDVMESLIGAIYIDAGFETAKNFILSHWNTFILNKKENIIKPSKSRLQEWSQKNNNVVPTYLYESIGTKEKPSFKVMCKIENSDIPIINVIAKNKKEGEMESSNKVIEYIKKNIDKNI